jgi:hypothetical protein
VEPVQVSDDRLDIAVVPINGDGTWLSAIRVEELD